MTIYSLYIINKAGGLIYQNDVNPGLSRLTANEYLVLAGTLHGVFAIASKLTPTALKVSTPSSISGVHNSATSSITSSSIGGGTNSSNNINSNSTILSNYSKGALNVVSNSNTSGLRSVDTKFFSIHIFQTLTGLKFLLVTSPNGLNSNDGINNTGSNVDLNKNSEFAESVLRRIYSIYSDYVMKNPFYSMDMPIRVDLFDQKVTELIKTLS
ncbi:Transport protein particle [Wickerhamomyces ciferrii]|uniref:Trafficking protein particle complex subunit n=1 Tax=Wickerhamomyces ciferrii (strain ATCC 14091 / BCRC 22168 / CBS 111 / JCM 3599 / NBRC 0793 / NRRL Y-1031 F-60-10) TaxID=1206466 RepID=K0KDQ7_WICCF|nr:Transport protein particle [Wickerhamomyces ciferrii]CCH41056.1 Transport protein particle [Wickerhamomyces ciferrii]